MKPILLDDFMALDFQKLKAEKVYNQVSKAIEFININILHHFEHIIDQWSQGYNGRLPFPPDCGEEAFTIVKNQFAEAGFKIDKAWMSGPAYWYISIGKNH